MTRFADTQSAAHIRFPNMSNRILISLLAFFFFGIAVASADDNTRAAQARLKEGGFYFGQVNGVYDSDTAAAGSLKVR